VAVVLDDYSNIVQLTRITDNPVMSSFPELTLFIEGNVLDKPHPGARLNAINFPSILVSRFTIPVGTAGNLRMKTTSEKVNFALMVKKWQKWVYYDHADEASPIAPETFTATLQRILCYRIPR
jgi:hypothetical protein